MANILTAIPVYHDEIVGIVNVQQLISRLDEESIENKLMETFKGTSTVSYSGDDLNHISSIMEYTENQQCVPQDMHVVVFKSELTKDDFVLTSEFDWNKFEEDQK